MTNLAGAAWMTLNLLLYSAIPPNRVYGRPADTENVILYLREHYGIPDDIKMTTGGLHDADAAEFYETIVTIDDGKPQDKKTQPVYLSKNGRFLVVGHVFALAQPGSAQEITQTVHGLFKLPANIRLTAAAPQKSIYPGFYSIQLTATNGRSEEYYLTADQRALVVGEIFALPDHPEEYFRLTVALADQPSAGLVHAPVTIVEYADLQCPYCAQMHKFLERDFLPKYRNKVQLIFKEFPLASHNWAFTAALANECAYQVDARAFLPYRTLIFRHQDDIDTVASSANLSTVREMLLDYAQQAGIDRTELAACLSSQASQSRVEENLKEGKLLGITRTPTFFINGKMQATLTPETFEKAVDAELRNAARARLGTTGRRSVR